jgi:copper chaperone CopZ
MSDHQLKPVEPVENQNDQAVLLTATVAFLDVLNMDCSKCATLVRNELSRLDGILVVDIFLEKGVAVVTYDPNRVTIDHLLSSIAKAGLSECRYYVATLIGNEPAR